MKNIRYAFFFFCVFIPFSSAQNLIRNGSFEETMSCSDAFLYPYDTAAYSNQYITAKYWVNPTWSTPDYFNKCTPYAFPPSRDVPLSSFGYQQPFTGNAYAGIVIYSHDIRNLTNPYTYYSM